MHGALQSVAQQMPWKQSPLAQSEAALQLEPIAHGGHSPPPQSMPVSPMSFLPLEQCAGGAPDELLLPAEDVVLLALPLLALVLDDALPPAPPGASPPVPCFTA
jgi:hypothetical protein